MVLLVAIALCGAYALWGRHLFSAKQESTARRGLVEEATTTTVLPKYRDIETLKVHPLVSSVGMGITKAMQHMTRSLGQ